MRIARDRIHRLQTLVLDRHIDPLSGKTNKKKLLASLSSLIHNTMGKPRGARSLADQLADFEDPTPKGME